MSILNLKSVEDTKLFKRLIELESHTDYGKDAKILASNLVQICKIATERMKLCQVFLPQFTLHDEIHLLRVTEIMSMLIPLNLLEELNPVELAILILVAFFHDQGMIIEKSELKDLDNNKDFKIFNENWCIIHPNYIEIKQQLHNKDLTIKEKENYSRIQQELNQALLTDFIRLTHGSRGRDYIISEFSKNPLWEISGNNFASIVGKITLSHTEPANNITPQNKYYYDVSFGSYKINVAFISIILRLADILDFDRERTPDVLFRAINFTSKVSINEWEKHRAIEGWIIQSNFIRYSMEFEHPAYEATARIFLDQIDSELAECSQLLREVPQDFSQYKIEFPLKVDRTRIGPKNDAYIFYPMEFSLSRDEIVKLLMTDKLYSRPSLCVRELLQNSLDALRFRKAIIKRDTSTEWNLGEVIFKHYIDTDGYEILSCEDNGIGMDESIVTKFLTKVGHSYYRSPEYEYERISFRNSNVDFDPCSRFGIGFMSCFMIGDNITIETRKDYGPQKGLGKPLIVEINGLSGIIVIRPGKHDQKPGTIVKIKGRKKPKYLDEWIDIINLIEVLDGYALACEFPIKGFCLIEEIKDEIQIAPEIELFKTEIEQARCKSFRNYEENFSDVNHNLSGKVKITVLLKENKISIANDEAKWIKDKRYFLETNQKTKIEQHYLEEEGQTCVDGILVCGQPGRKREPRKLGSRANAIQLCQKHDSFLIDFRGDIKPELTPSRIPPEYSIIQRPKSWVNVNYLANVAIGKLWAKILKSLYEEKQPELFWELSIIHQLWPGFINTNYILEYMFIPVLSVDGKMNWSKIDDQNTFHISTNNEKKSILFDNRTSVAIPEKLNEMIIDLKETKLIWSIEFLLKSLSSLKLEDDNLIYRINHFRSNQVPMNSILSKVPFGIIICIPFEDNLSDCMTVFDDSPILNKNNPVVNKVLQNEHYDNDSEFDLFLSTTAHFFSDKDNVEILTEKNITKVTRWTKIFANRYNSIEWNSIDLKFKPPYKFFIKDIGFVYVTHEDFERWLSLPEKK